MSVSCAYYAPAPRVGALSDDARRSDVVPAYWRWVHSPRGITCA